MIRNRPTRADRRTATDERAREVLRETLAFARRRDYTGWDYCDGMSSRIRRALPFENRWVNLLFQETAKRAPVNVRPLLLVEQRRNYKGTALFSMANCHAHDLGLGAGRPSTDGGMEQLADESGAVDRHHGGETPGGRRRDRVDYAAEARDLAEWLVDEQCEGYGGYCGGHRHEVQLLQKKAVPEQPDLVSTAYGVQALLAAERFDPEFARIARTAADFVVEDLDYREVDGGAKVDYNMNEPDGVYTLNAGALGARLFVDLYDRFGDEAYRRRATRILDYLVTKRTDRGGWLYREPADASHLSMDNHHNGFIVETYLRYREVVDPDRYEHTLRSALRFYREDLFEPNGAPNFDEDSAYPRDVHAAAQGILVFTHAGEYEFARRILQWTLDELYAGDGRFYFRKHRLFTRRITLMRWCQAWMAYAISTFLAASAGDAATPQ